MKPKKLSKKLVFNKKTIANLVINELEAVKGGTTIQTCPTMPTYTCTCVETCLPPCGPFHQWPC